MERLNAFLGKVDLSELRRFILENGTERVYRRGEVVCRQGMRCPIIAIVRSGYFQYSVINSKGEVCITGFSFEDEVLTDYVCSFVFSMPSFTSICAGSDATLLQVGVGEAREFIEQRHPHFYADVTPVLLMEAYRRYLDVHTKTPKERYVELFSRCHGNLSSIPLQEIASFLSISRRQFQRIRESMM